MEAEKLYQEKVLKLIKDLPEENLPQIASLIEKRSLQYKAVRDLCGKYSSVKTSADAFSKRKAEEKLLDL